MPDHDQRPGVEGTGAMRGHEGAQLDAVAGVVQARVRARRVEPRDLVDLCLLYTSPSPRDRTRYRMSSSA